MTAGSTTKTKLEITDLSRGGSGVARDASGRVIFVPWAMPGDVVEVEILEGKKSAKKNYAQARLLSILKPSPERVLAPCPIFTKCGGCQWQHVPYSLQWKTKSNGVKQALERVQVALPEKSFELFPAEKIWGYRNRVQLRGYKNQMGFYGSGTNDLIPAEKCPIAREEINAEWEKIKAKGSLLAKPYKVEIEVTSPPTSLGEVGVTWNSPHAASGFRQIHDEQNEKLRLWISGVITPGQEVYDLYGGSGNLSLLLAPKMKSVECVDSYLSASKIQFPTNMTFHRSSVLSWLQKKAKSVDQATSKAAILDPPRIGLSHEFSEIAQALEALGVRQLVLVGCDVDVWAKDISKFLKRKWTLQKVAVFDFFPQTPHVESAGLLSN